MAMARPPFSRVAFLLFLALAVAAAASSHAGAAGAATASEQRGPPTDGEPGVFVILLDGTGGGEAALAVQAHDLSLVAFCNGSGHWHAFPGHGHVIDPSMSTPLPFSNTYRDLIGGLANLPGLPLGQGPSAWATSVLAAYNPAAGDAAAVKALKRALVTMMVTTIEAQRLRPVAAAVAKGWVSSDGRVAPEHLPYIEHWDTICYELVRARRTGEWGGLFTELLRERAGIRGEEDALTVVGMVVNRTLAELVMAHARSA